MHAGGAPARPSAPPPGVEADAVVIGAGPVGLYQVFQLGLQGIRAHVIDALPTVGGQPQVLYPDKTIYDLPALPACTGAELVQALHTQAAQFQPVFHLGHVVQTLSPQPDGRLQLTTDRGVHLLARDVFIAAGVGAFEARRLRGPGLDALDGLRVFHPPLQTPPDAAWAGASVWVCGGDDTALDWAFRLCDRGDLKAVTLLHRRDVFDAPPQALQRLQHLRQSGALHVRVGQVVGAQVDGAPHDPQAPMTLHLQLPTGAVEPHAADQLLVCLGLSPRLGPIAHWGLAMARKQLVVDPARFATDVAHVYAVGDVNTYPGKRKLFTCGFHEATLAAYAAAESAADPSGLAPPPPQLYTSSSRLLQQRLGVWSAPAG